VEVTVKQMKTEIQAKKGQKHMSTASSGQKGERKRSTTSNNKRWINILAEQNVSYVANTSLICAI